MMSDSEMELSVNTRSNISSRSSTPKPVQPLSDRERRRNAMERLKKQQMMIDGYQKYLACTRNHRNDTGIHSDLEKNLQETKETRDRLVSELRTMPLCLIFNCPDHTTLEAKNNEPKNATDNINSNDNDKKTFSEKKK
ncbi:uncharacterized protein TNCV_4789081 [Trichonephila clavipes]|nr:uncharacterized protein TNCV_4789081 [Trichonephila clavipes]